jgi:hypothetical protein
VHWISLQIKTFPALRGGTGAGGRASLVSNRFGIVW